MCLTPDSPLAVALPQSLGVTGALAEGALLKFCFTCRMGGIPAVNGKGERLLLHVGIIDILQSYRWVSCSVYFLADNISFSTK